jgi:hypothetical protein
MPLNDLKGKIHNIVRSFERRYESNIFFFPEDKKPCSVIHVKMTDEYHDMNLYLQVELKTLTILDLGIEENRVPYESCPMAAKNYLMIIGKQISKLGKEKPENKILGCLHINELLEESTRVFNAAYGFYLKEKNYPNEYNEEKMFVGDLPRSSRREIARHWWMKDRRVRNSCHSFNTITENTEMKTIAANIPSFTEMILESMRD